MADYQKMYAVLCGAIDDVLDGLRTIPLAQPYARQLYSALLDAEDIYIDTTFYTGTACVVPVALFPYSEPVMVSSEVPGSTVNTPVAASWVNVAAGTVSAPTTVANVPVVSS